MGEEKCESYLPTWCKHFMTLESTDDKQKALLTNPTATRWEAQIATRLFLKIGNYLQLAMFLFTILYRFLHPPSNL